MEIAAGLSLSYSSAVADSAGTTTVAVAAKTTAAANI